MKTNLFLIVVIAISGVLFCSSCSKDDDNQGPSTSTDAVITVPFFVTNENGQIPSEANELIYELRKMNPITAPDGHQLTWGEFSSVRGMIDVQCMGESVEVSMELTGLIPNGVYTFWNVVFDAPGMDPTDPMLGLEGLGAAGVGNGSDNIIIASADGKGKITMNSPGGALSMVSNTDLGNCPLTDNFEWHVVGAYHLDNQTHGPLLGPDGTAVEQFGFIFQNNN